MLVENPFLVSQDAVDDTPDAMFRLARKESVCLGGTIRAPLVKLQLPSRDATYGHSFGAGDTCSHACPVQIGSVCKNQNIGVVRHQVLVLSIRVPGGF